GSLAIPRRAFHPAEVVAPTQTSAGRSSVPGARLHSVDWTAPAVSPTSWASSPCPASLVTVILANSVSQETGSDLVLEAGRQQVMPDRALRLDEAAPLLAMSQDFLYRNWKRLGGYKDADHHIKFRMSDVQRHLQRKAKEGRP